ncbi:MAG: hypothetical protein A2W99_04540 [Bacteroidetes bacterium GWF2_33_16]|nr:MAG: hypothetical protein A2X00_17060 [Bacteroidetes bacterium GWE2_32_14]OFY05938.1 MAG: hypothetical protein A2W99_04540 [Bacteroidetes bacterium GWF2_33_16]
MASCKELKKDINFLAQQIMTECFSYLEYSPVNNQENVLEILHETEELRRELIYRANHLPKGTKLEKKNYYKEISEDLVKRNIELLDRLNSLSDF